MELKFNENEFWNSIFKMEFKWYELKLLRIGILISYKFEIWI